jgi:hypothetical protein
MESAMTGTTNINTSKLPTSASKNGAGHNSKERRPPLRQKMPPVNAMPSNSAARQMGIKAPGL